MSQDVTEFCSKCQQTRFDDTPWRRAQAMKTSLSLFSSPLHIWEPTGIDRTLRKSVSQSVITHGTMDRWFESMPQTNNPTNNNGRVPPPRMMVTILSGWTTFSASLAVSTWIQQRFVKVTTATLAPIPTLCGIVSVTMASLASHHVALTTGRQQRNDYNSYHQPSSTTTTSTTTKHWNTHNRMTTHTANQDDDILDLKYMTLPLSTIRICCLGLFTFVCLGGRFWAIAPSSYTHLGSFARGTSSLQATHRYATTSERAVIDKLGRRFWPLGGGGCHTCGTHMWFASRRVYQFVGDHMPPKSVAVRLNNRWYRKLFNKQVSYRFYPQCKHCSNMQGTILSQAVIRATASSSSRKSLVGHGLSLSRAPSYFHGHKLRWNHWTGAVLGYMVTPTTSDNDNDTNMDGQYRYRQYQQILQRNLSMVRNQLAIWFPKQ